MTTPYANVTVSNIIAGPCTSFTVDSNQIGGTQGGVTVERQMKFTGLQVDQVPGDVADIITGDEITIKTTLSEATLKNLQLMWNVTAAPVTATTPATNTLNVGVETGIVKTHSVVFVGPCPTGTYASRTYTIGKVSSYATGQSFKLEKNGPTLYPVTFKAYPDLTKTAGQEYGTIVDQ